MAEIWVAQAREHVRVPRHDPHALAGLGVHLEDRRADRTHTRIERVAVGARLRRPELGGFDQGLSSASAAVAAATTVSRCAGVSVPLPTKNSAVSVTLATNAAWFANGALSHTMSRNVSPSSPREVMPVTGMS